MSVNSSTNMAHEYTAQATISFCIPVYNVRAYLDECLQSVVTGCRTGDEVVLVDDGSTDGSGQLCDQWRIRYPDLIRVIHKSNGGLSSARNRGALESRCKYVYFLDSDDVLCAETMNEVRLQLNTLQPDVLTCDAILWREDHAQKKRLTSTLPAGVVVTGAEALKCALADDFMSTSSRIFNRHFLLAEGPAIFPEGRYYEDNTATPLLLSRAARVAYFPAPLYLYRARPGSITQTQTTERCIHQATSYARPLREIAILGENSTLQALANALAFSHIVTAVRHASAVPGVTAADFSAVIREGMASLTLRGDALLDALRRSPYRSLVGHAKDMQRRPHWYLFKRLVLARWKQRRAFGHHPSKHSA